MSGGMALVSSLALAAAVAGSHIPLARLALVEQRVEVVSEGGTWQRAVEGASLSPGQSLRTGSDGLARVELSWMALTLTPGSTLRLPDALVLSAALDVGRALVEGEQRDTLKLVTPEAEVRGRGRAVVRREGGRTLVSCLSGRFHVAARRGAVMLTGGQGTLVERGGAPSAPQPLPEAPGSALWPARDPVYATGGGSVELRWQGKGAFQIELLPVGSEVVLLQRDVGPPPARITIPWEGAFRWRVAARDARGLEGLPSPEGLIAVEK